jgi:hypothetical protein
MKKQNFIKMNKNINILILIVFLITITAGFANAVTVTGQSSSYTFNVINCTNDYVGTMGCGSDTATFSCNVTPSSFVNYVNFRVNGNNFLANQDPFSPDIWTLTYNKPQEATTNTNPIILDREQIIDIQAQGVNAFLTSSINHNCTTCPTTLTRTPIAPCTTANTQLISYTSSNQICSPDYNVTETCDYCTESIFQNATECNENKTTTISYYDENYNTCCLVTGLTSDCHILNYPYNQITNQTCDFYPKDFTCNVDQNPVLNDKINTVCTMPDSQDYCCVVNIYQGNNLLATTPEYKDPSNSLLNINMQGETRTCFTPNNRLVNAYYTKKELRPNTEYKLQIQCTNNQTTINSNYPINPEYHIPDWGTQRIQWIGKNPATIILSFVLLIAIILFIAYMIRKARGR